MSSTDTQSSRLVGQVKWFNNKAGYGFVTVNDGENSGKDIFVHYSAIRVTNSQYKYLFQGEYVEFDLVKSSTDSHEFQANDVSGIKGGSLMCELRRTTRTLDDNKPRRAPRQDSSEEKADGDFTTVRRRNTKPKPAARKPAAKAADKPTA